MPRRLETLVLGLIVAGLGCGGDSASGPSTPSSPASLVAVSPQSQTGTAGAPVAAPIVVRVLDSKGAPLSGVTVAFAVTGGGGSVSPLTAITASDGQASAAWTLGTLPGPNAATALAGSLPPLVFLATGQPAPPAQIVPVGGNNQGAVVGTTVTDSIVVLVRDAFGNPVSGVSVSFAVTAGGGTVSPVSRPTAANGRAAASWTLGVVPGVNTVSVTAAGLAQASIVFTATGIVGAPDSIVPIAGSNQSATVGTMVSVAPAVRVVDRYGNPIPSVAVSFAVDSGAAVVTGGVPLTDMAGHATVGSWQLDTLARVNTLRASVGVIAPAIFTATGLAGPAHRLFASAGDNQTALAGTAVAVRPSAKVVDTYGNPVSGTGVTFAVASGGGVLTGGSQVSGAGGIATVGSWTLGTTPGLNTLTATATGLIGSPVTFTATGVTTVSPFTIDLVFLNGPTAAQSAAFTNAKTRWEQAIVGDLEDFNVGTVSLNSCGVNTTVSGAIDDLKIVVELKPYDGVGGVLGAATPCFLRPDGPNPDTPIIGYMFFDTADLANLEQNGSLSDVVLHEMGHVLGFGTIWEGFSFNVIAPGVVGPTGIGYIGSNGLTAFLTLNNGNGTVVPVDATGGAGTARSHWDETLFKSEIMTGFISGTIRPLSATSIASLADIGYTVNTAVANPFDYTNPATLRAGPEPAPISFGNDIVKGTIMYVEKGTGRTWAVPRR
jgi:hypothetical protein